MRFNPAEHVMYDLYFNWKFVWVKAGLASLTTNYHSHNQPTGLTCLLWAVTRRISFKIRDTLTCGGWKNWNRAISAKVPKGENVTRLMRAWFIKNGLCLVNQKRTYRDGAFDESE